MFSALGYGTPSVGGFSRQACFTRDIFPRSTTCRLEWPTRSSTRIRAGVQGQESIDIADLVESLDSNQKAKPTVYCYGCGLELQTESAENIGFVSEEKMEVKLRHKQRQQLLCNRCVELAQGKMIPGVQDSMLTQKETKFSNLVSPNELRDKLKHIRNQRVLVVLLVDLLDIPGSFLNALRPLIGSNPIFLVGTKLDLLPKSTQVKAMQDWLKEIALEKKLNVVDVHLVSNHTDKGVARATSSILRTRKGRDVYVMGLANVGKSAFVKTLLRELRNITSFNFTPDAMAKKNFLPVESSMPGTTLGVIKLQALERQGAVFDTPGIHIFHRVTHMLSPDDLKEIHPRKPLGSYVPPTPYEISKQMLQKERIAKFDKEGDNEDLLMELEEDPEVACCTYYWGGLVRIDVLEAPIALGFVFVGPSAMKTYAFPLMSEISIQPPDVVYESVVHGDMSNCLVTTRYLEVDVPSKKQKQKKPDHHFFGKTSVLRRGGLSLAHKLEINSLGFDEILTEISVSGLPGWITISIPKGSPRTQRGVFRGRVWAPRGVEVFLRSPIPVHNPLNHSH